MDRKAAQAGRFYPGTPEKLTHAVQSYLEPLRESEIPALGVISPHAGYVYSGSVAGHLLASVEIPDSVVMMGPNHTGRGRRAAILSDGVWHLPGIEAAVDHQLATTLKAKCPLLEEDYLAHEYEHGLEVQLPFLLRRNPRARHVPIVLGRLSYRECERLAAALVEAVDELGRRVLLLASSDMNHFEDAETTRRKDFLAIERVLAGDAPGLFRVIAEHGISMCGFIPTAIMLLAAKRLGASSIELLEYKHSGEVNGDNSSVVGYASVAAW
ncbi:MAG: AmmeMemoRadiSam system protein B [Myxococcales bacterium]|nr:AmmeMemoRadiSam system protein B [Myxococcales bacterium]